MTTTRRDDGSLFVDVTTITVDPAYVEAAARRATEGDPEGAERAIGLVALAAALALVGLLVGVAARQTRQRAPAVARLRTALVGETERRTALTDRLGEQVERLRADNARVRDRRLQSSAAGRELARDLARLGLVTGDGAVRGRGIEVRLADSTEPRGGAEEEGRIRDTDLQQVANALWAAGAEAVAINGQRLSTLTAIREAGQAILVDYRPLSPPYVVAAVGDPDEMELAFADSPTARRFRTWQEVFGLSFDVRRRGDLRLPAAETTRLRHAVAVPKGTR